MRNRFLITSLAATLSLTACFGEKNPLSEISPTILANEIFEIGEDANDCMQLWNNPKAASPQGVIYQTCEDSASKIAIHFTKAGYGDITAYNVKSLDNWDNIEAEVKVLRKTRRENVGNTMKNVFPDWSKQP
jgi:hypothetical protein